MKTKKYFIRTFGCQMNEYDSILIAESLEEYGYFFTANIKEADLILFNTCAIRGLAEHKAISELGATKKLKAKNPQLLVGMIGCVAQKLGKELTSKYPFIDFVFGTKEMYKIAEFLEAKGQKSLVRTDLSQEIVGYQTKKVNSVSASVTIVRGCTNFCTYCIVPYVRGKEESRSIAEIETEVKNLIKNGVKEVILLGQNVNAYENFAELLARLNKIEQLKRIRYVTSHPKSVDENFIAQAAKLHKVCEHIHLPFQSGSNKILQAMNRKYTKEEYLEKLATIRKYKPEMGITSDIIVGFPGETEEDFLATLSLLDQAQLDNVYSFKYSPREGTMAFKNMPDDVAPKEKKARLARLHEVNEKIALKLNEEMIGKVYEVLWENVKEYQGQKVLEGRTRNFKKTFAAFKDGRIGALDQVKIMKVTMNSLFGKIVDEYKGLSLIHI